MLETCACSFPVNARQNERERGAKGERDRRGRERRDVDINDISARTTDLIQLHLSIFPYIQCTIFALDPI